MSGSAPVVAIDGPAGSGKSTIARQLAMRLGFTHIDTGALYRGIALVAMEKKVDLSSESAVVAAIQDVSLVFRIVPEGNILHINGRNVGPNIRLEEVGKAASLLSTYPGVRGFLLGLQRELGAKGNVVLEGRDIGTVVFPKAEVKIFLTASLEERTKRRAKELAEKGIATDENQLKIEIAQRDKQDSERLIAPLRCADDAVLVDTSGLTIDSVLDRLESLVRNAK